MKTNQKKEGLQTEEHCFSDSFEQLNVVLRCNSLNPSPSFGIGGKTFGLAEDHLCIVLLT